jgi:hypothetical protein
MSLACWCPLTDLAANMRVYEHSEVFFSKFCTGILISLNHRVGRVLSFFSSRLNWDSPNPSPVHECGPPPFGSGGEGHTRWRERGWESPNSNEGTYTVVYSLYVRTVLCGLNTLQTRPPLAPPPPCTVRKSTHLIVSMVYSVQCWNFRKIYRG